MAGHLQAPSGPGSGADKTAPRTSPSPAEGATTRRFYYSDQWQVLEEYVGNSTTPEVRYWYGIRDINDIVRRQFIDPDDPTDLYALRDTMNVVALVNASGVVQQRMAYDAFGNTRFLTSAFAAGSNAAGWNLLFHGHYRDADTGLYQMRFRYYHPNLGVWLSRDPIGEEGGVNLYGVVEDDAVNLTDPSGLVPEVLSPHPAMVHYEVDRKFPGDVDWKKSVIRYQGCVGIARAAQGYMRNPIDGSSRFNPETAPGVKCFNTEPEAKAVKCAKGRRPVIFAIEGTRRHANRPATGEIPVDTIITDQKQFRFNYCTLVGKYWYWNTGPMTPILRDRHPSQSYINPKEDTIYCVDCLCPGARSRVICTHLHDLGLLDSSLWKADIEFTRTLSNQTIKGYHYWAIPCVRLMRRWKFLNWVILPLAKARAREVAFIMGRSPRGSILGKFVRLLGEPICYFIGNMAESKSWESLWQAQKTKD